MKSLFAIAFNCAYLTLTVGVAQTTHYCMGRLNHTAYFSYRVEPCFCSILTGKLDSCCYNESILIQVDDDQTQVAPVEVSPAQLPILEVFDYLLASYFLPKKPIQSFPEKYFRPPPIKAYVMNCSFVFYDANLA